MEEQKIEKDKVKTYQVSFKVGYIESYIINAINKEEAIKFAKKEINIREPDISDCYEAECVSCDELEEREKPIPYVEDMLSIRVPEQLKNKFKAVCCQQRKTMQHVLNDMLWDFVSDKK